MVRNRPLILLLLAALPVCAQMQDGSFEGQTPGISVSLFGPWSSSGAAGMTNIEPGGSFGGPDSGFPCNGTQFALLNNLGVGPAPALPSGGGLHAPGTVAEVRQTFLMPNPPVIGFCWTWVTTETVLPSTQFNDFASVDLVDAASGANVANLLFVDTGVNQNNLPGALGGPSGGPFFVPSASAIATSASEVAPAGPKQACIDLTGVATPGTLYTLVAVCGNGGSPNFLSALYLDDFNHACTPTPPPTDQPNCPQATLTFSGSTCLPPGTLPLDRRTPSGGALSMTASSGATAPATPFAVFFTLGVPAMSPGLPSPFGLINLDAAALQANQYGILVNGIAPLTLIDLLAGNTGPNGTLALNFVMPPSPGLIGAFQAVFVDATSPFGLKLSAATNLTATPSVTAPPSSCIGTVPSGLLNNQTVNVPFAPGFTFPYYGTLYTNVWVNTHGSLSFGAAGNTDFSETATEFLSQGPRVAGFWNSFNPPNGAIISYTASSASFVVSWVNVPEFGTTNSNNFCITLVPAGAIAFDYGRMDSPNGLVGISPGNGLAADPPIDLTAGPVGGLPNQALYEVFVGANTPDLVTCLSNPGGPLVFLPNPPLAVPGDNGYLMIP